MGPTLAILLSVAACLGSRQRGEGCACGPDPRDSGAVPAPTSSPRAAEADAGPERIAAEPVDIGSVGAEPPEATPQPPPDFSDPTWTLLTSRAGAYEVFWRSLSGKVPRNEDFTLEVWVLRNGVPLREARLGVNAWMPDHGHGMLRNPLPTARGDGSFRIEGMLLHMRGHWQLFFEVIEGTLSETAECELDL